MFSIGEFSKITGLTVKTLRFYHEQGVLEPSYVDPQTGYRYYAENKIDVALLISQLRKLDFSVAQIEEILRGYDDEAGMLACLKRQRDVLDARLRQYRAMSRLLDQIIHQQQEALAAMNTTTFEVEEKSLEPMLIAAVRMKGKYSLCGQGFAQIGRRLGRQICGQPMLLHYDCDYKEDDAEFEACMPVKKGTPSDGITVRELPGGRCVALLHRGPYEELGRSYAKILQYIKQQGYAIQSPTREVYIKCPGMIFKGNPKSYLTEIQMLIEPLHG